MHRCLVGSVYSALTTAPNGSREKLMATPAKPQIRNVLATPARRAGRQWLCQPIALGSDDRICIAFRGYVKNDGPELL